MWGTDQPTGVNSLSGTVDQMSCFLPPSLEKKPNLNPLSAVTKLMGSPKSVGYPPEMKRIVRAGHVGCPFEGPEVGCERSWTHPLLGV
jgi:hypothetical protein